MDLIGIEIGVLKNIYELARPVMGTIFLVKKVIGLAKQVPHWGVQSIFHMIYTVYVGMSVLGGYNRPVIPMLFISIIL